MKFLLSFLGVIFCFSAIAQMDPVSWEIESRPTDDPAVFEVVLTANIQDSWVIYSKETEPDGPIPTSLSFEVNKDFELLGDYSESKVPETKYSDLFEINVSKFSEEISLVQKVKRLSETAEISAAVTFMTCSGDRCLPPKEVVLMTKI